MSAIPTCTSPALQCWLYMVWPKRLEMVIVLILPSADMVIFVVARLGYTAKALQTEPAASPLVEVSHFILT